MPTKFQTTANALNGQEIKDIIKLKLNKIVDEIPLLRIGNTFASAEIGFGFTMKAYPADIPVPDDFEVEFEISSPNEEDKQNAENMKKFVNGLIDERDETFERYEKAIDRFVKIIEKEGSFTTASAPDKTRHENGLEIPVIQETPTGRAEIGISGEDLGLPRVGNGGQFGK
jgi:hypothetical protein